MSVFEQALLLLIAIDILVQLLNYNSGRGSYSKGYKNGFSDGVSTTLSELKKSFAEFVKNQKSAK